MTTSQVTEIPNDPTAAAPPAAQGKSGRAANGQFLPGNAGGPGNPYARQTALYRKSMRQVATAEDMNEVTAALLLKAKAGDLAAAKILYEYVIGKPAARGDPDRLDIEELELFRESVTDVPTADRVMRGLPAGHFLIVARAAVPEIGDAGLADLGYGLEALDAKDARRARRLEEKRKAKEARRHSQRTEPVPSADGENGPDRPMANGSNGPDAPIANGGNGPDTLPPNIGRVLRPIAGRDEDDFWGAPPANGGNGHRP